MSELIVFFVGVVIGVIYEKRIRKYKEVALRAAKAASKEFHQE